MVAALKAEMSPEEVEMIIWEHLTEEGIEQVATTITCPKRTPKGQFTATARRKTMAPGTPM